MRRVESLNDIALATQVMRDGGVIAYPTEAVWGLGCDPWQHAAVERILTIKGRSVSKGLILVASRMAQLQPLLAPLSAEQQQVLASHWPGPFTFLIPDPGQWAPAWVRGEHDSVAVRVSAHPVVRELCECLGKPLVSTSANRSGAGALRCCADVIDELGSELDAVVDGDVDENASPSRICDLVSGRILRS